MTSVPAGRHRVARVDGEVHQHLLELTRVDAHAPEVGVLHRHQLDVLAQQPAQHTVDVEHEAVEIDDARLDDLAPGKRQQLAGEVGGPLRGARDLGDVAARRVGGRHVVLRHLGVPENRGQQVVEVMCDAAGQPADAFHALGQQQLMLEPPQFRDVLADDQQVRAVARCCR